MGVLACVALSRAYAAPVTLAVDPAASRIDISVKATVDSFVATLSVYKASVQVDSVTGGVGSAELSFRFSDVKTGNEKRDKEMLTWEQSDTFPEGRFRLVSLVAEGQGRFSAKGSLTLHGQSQDLTFPVTIDKAGAGLVVAGEATLDTRTFGLPIIKKFGLLKVDPLVVVRFHLVGMPTGT